MSVSGHLRIEIDEYDVRIRTFVPWYEDLLARVAEAASRFEASQPLLVDLGIGTGALSAACLAERPEARIVGIDADPGMLAAARARLGEALAASAVGDFETVEIPGCDGIVSCLALHHVPTPDRKRALYRRCAAALRPGGALVSGDCFASRHGITAMAHRELWLAHLERTYSPAEAAAHLDGWSEEDFYFPLEEELGWLREAGLEAETLWRRDSFAVIAGFAPGGAG